MSATISRFDIRSLMGVADVELISEDMLRHLDERLRNGTFGLPHNNRRIVETIQKGVYLDRVNVIDHASGFCLRAVREVLEATFSIQLYRDYVHDRVERNRNDSWDWWARDVERSLRNRGMAVSNIDDRLPGDILFHWRSAPTGTVNAQGHPNYYGHVGILMPGDLIFENINPKHRTLSFNRAMLSLTPYESWGYRPSTVIRFDPNK